jgi:uncharacterized membrane protein YjfL (UPF0719 family)
MERIAGLLAEFARSFAWAVVAALSMSVSLGLLLKVFDLLTPIDEWEEIKKGNVSVAIILAAVIIAFGIVVGLAISSPDTIGAPR